MTGTKSIGFALVALFFLTSAPPPSLVVGSPENRITIEYVPGETAEHNVLRSVLMEHRILEQFRDFLGMLKLPRELRLVFDGCEGEADAWYEPTLYQVTICYEYIEELRKKAPKETT